MQTCGNCSNGGVETNYQLYRAFVGGNGLCRITVNVLISVYYVTSDFTTGLFLNPLKMLSIALDGRLLKMYKDVYDVSH